MTIPNTTLKKLHQEFLQSAGIATDTRQPVRDALFFALKGERYDGNSYVRDALEKGCRLAVTEDPELKGEDRVVWVPSTLKMLQQLATLHRQHVDPAVLAITGSNGKTTTKELIYKILEQKYRVLATSGNLNNHVGVPLTLLQLVSEEVAVIEMGANHQGEIRDLVAIAQPGIGIITNVGKAHLEGFGSLEGVLDAKGELYEYLAEHGGKAIVDTGNHTLMQKALSRGLQVLGAGEEGALRVSARVTGQSPFLEVELRMNGRSHPIRTRMVGAFNASNILYAAATGLQFEITPDSIAAAIAAYLPQNHRSQWIKGRSNSLMLDAYNANPTSMKEAINGLMDFASGPVMLILGDMAELGKESVMEHRKLEKWVRSLHPECVYLVGPIFHSTCTSTKQVKTFRSREELDNHLREHPPQGYHILLKGSRVMEMEKVAGLLVD